METRQVIINGKPTYLLIYEDGRLYSTRRRVFLRPFINHSGYLVYQVSRICGRSMFAHTLVALHFLKGPPGGGYEVNHKDLDKLNNHWSNLEWVTHSYNIFHARGIDPWDARRCRGFTHSKETRDKMSRAKFKPVIAIKGDEEMVFGSIKQFLDYFGIYRKKFNRVVNSLKKIDGWSVRYV